MVPLAGFRYNRTMSRLLTYSLCLAVAFVLDGGPADADTSKAQVSKRDCKRLVRHSPGADVEYKPGVDVRGRKVAAADAGGAPKLRLPNVFEFDLKFAPISSGLLKDTEMAVGKVRFDVKSGRLTYDGQPLNDAQQADLGRQCRQMLSRGK